MKTRKTRKMRPSANRSLSDWTPEVIQSEAVVEEMKIRFEFGAGMPLDQQTNVVGIIFNSFACLMMPFAPPHWNTLVLGWDLVAERYHRPPLLRPLVQ
ncbi:hypothetical protein NDU88_003961 [Pleurodeles waltl]|uniref:Uncharacterized protein n=1 Tax=Pleurodeles waltl TaxID=8319 RepID=A0AAV7SHE9_PLEWA|nr:hypothetical protein NDU88_003961 [Pleurodeles waltl]